MNKCKLIVRDAVNVRFEGLDIEIKKKMSDALKFKVPEARHMPMYKLGRWDGTVSFFSAAGSTYLNLLDRLLPILDAAAIDIDVDDRRPPFSCSFPPIDSHMVADRVWPAGHTLAGQPILLREYQVEAIKNYFENWQSLQAIATGAGKSLITACLSLCVELSTGGRTMVIVPSKSLVVQTEDDYKNLGLDVGVFYGDRKEWDRQHVIASWQALSILSKKSKKGSLELGIMEFIKGMDCVIVDEAHSIQGTQLKDLLCGPLANIPLRWGLTGTIPKEEHKYIPLICSIGPVVGEIRASELQERGVLAQCKIELLQLQDDHVEFRDYDTEHKFLMSDVDRMEWLARRITTISASGNTLVLVDRVETGEFLKKLVPDSVFVSGSTKQKNRQKEYDEVQTAGQKVIIATYGVAAVGINIPRLFNCVLLECGKSFVRTVQSIGRILRRANDKNNATVYDISSSLKFSKRHLTKRKEYYKDAGYPFTMSKVTYR